MAEKNDETSPEFMFWLKLSPCATKVYILISANRYEAIRRILIFSPKKKTEPNEAQTGFDEKIIILFEIVVFLAAYLKVHRCRKKKNPDSKIHPIFLSSGGNLIRLKAKSHKPSKKAAIPRR